jgi:Dolichyl-phosphate-mannose-protein mannosyltransferase
MRPDRAACAGLVLVLCCATAVGALGIARGLFLIDAGSGSRWLVAVTPSSLRMHPRDPVTAVFRVSFTLVRPQGVGALELRAVDSAEVRLDGESIYRDPEPAPPGRAVRTVAHPALGAGEHALEISVVAAASPPLLWVRSDSLQVSTSSGAWQYHWEGEAGAARYAPFATDPLEPFAISREYPESARALRSLLPALGSLFVLAFVWAWRGGRGATPLQLRFGLLAFWVALAVNNIARLRAGLGMDVDMHLDYVRELVVGHHLPLASEGGQMMQPPLAYLLYAPLYVAFSKLSAPAMEQAMRILSFACGAAQVELAYRAGRVVFPDRSDLQRVAILVGGLLPINVYLAHAVANEPVVALFGGATAVAALRIAIRERPPAARELVAAGVLLGLALLSKVTAVLLAPALLFAVVVRSLGPERAIARAAADTARVIGVAALVSGWYYARNWIVLGAPFVGTWEADVRNPWWQEPGFRTAAQYLRFGEGILHPIFAVRVGLWDGLYSTLWLDGELSAQTTTWSAPPWNVTPLLAGAWLALAPTLALAVGALGSFRRADSQPQQRWAQVLAAGTIALYVLATLYHHLMVPFYCAVKGSYLAAATPFFAVLAAAGYAELARARWLGAAVAAGLVCWAANVIATYWVL